MELTMFSGHAWLLSDSDSGRAPSHDEKLGRSRNFQIVAISAQEKPWAVKLSLDDSGSYYACECVHETFTHTYFIVESWKAFF